MGRSTHANSFHQHISEKHWRGRFRHLKINHQNQQIQQWNCRLEIAINQILSQKRPQITISTNRSRIDFFNFQKHWRLFIRKSTHKRWWNSKVKNKEWKPNGSKTINSIIILNHFGHYGTTTCQIVWNGQKEEDRNFQEGLWFGHIIWRYVWMERVGDATRCPKSRSKGDTRSWQRWRIHTTLRKQNWRTRRHIIGWRAANASSKHDE